MKTPDPLHDMLQQWKVEPTIPSRFQSEVWTRIQRREDARQTSWQGLLQNWLTPGLRTWQFATAAIAAMVVIGASAGSLSASSIASQTRTELALDYVQSVDPYLHLASLKK